MSGEPLPAGHDGSAWRLLLATVPRLAFACGVAALIGLVLVVLWEVGARRLFNAPTIWAFDLAGYFQAGGFLLVAGELLRRRQHITIDVFSKLLPLQVRAVIDLLVAVLLVLACTWLAIVGVRQAAHAWSTGQVDWVSVWAPKLWPYYSIVALSMISLVLAALYRLAEAGISLKTGKE